MFAAQHLNFDEPNRWLTSGGLGTMGYGLPAAMGAQAAHRKAAAICISGDGSFMMNLQELATCMQFNLPVKTFVLNNKYLGMVRQWQEMFHEERYSETVLDVNPDLVKLAEAFGAKGIRITKPDQVDQAIKDALAHNGPVIVDVMTDAKENVFPMIPAGAAHNEILLGPKDVPQDAHDDNVGGMVLT